MSERLRTAINLALSALMLLAFTALFWLEVGRTARGDAKPTDPINDPQTYAATATAGAVASVVAAALALPISTAQQGESVRSRIKFRFSRLPDAVGGAGPTGDQLKKYLALAYVITYVGIGIASFVIWLKFDASGLVKVQALTLLGLMLASVRATFL